MEDVSKPKHFSDVTVVSLAWKMLQHPILLLQDSSPLAQIAPKMIYSYAVLIRETFSSLLASYFKVLARFV